MSNAFSGFGFPAEGTINYLFPTEMFLEGSDLTPLSEHMEELLAGLTSWEPVHKGTGMSEVQTVEIEGKDYQDVFQKANKLFLRNAWGDDLPIIPPTDEMVDWILTGTDYERDHVFGTVPPRGGVATTHSVAVCLAMAGGRPEYMPVFLAIVQACISKACAMQSWNSTTNSCVPCIIVNGPVAKQIRLGHNYGCLGPNATYPAGQVICRALRILQMTLGGGLPGTGDMAIFGGLSATNVVFAEDEDNVPEGWKLWSEERGHPRGTNVVTMTLVNSKINIYWLTGDRKANDQTLTSIGKIMGTPNITKFDKYSGDLKHDGTDEPYRPDSHTGLLLLPPAFVKLIIDNNDMTQEKLRERLWEESKLPYELVEAMGYMERAIKYSCIELPKPGDKIAYTPDARNLHMAFAGGESGLHGYWMTGMCQGKVVDAVVELPKNWDDLLLDAEIDLGPAPAN